MRNQALNTLGLSIELRPTSEITLRLGPAWESERGLQGTAPEDYREIALEAGFEFMEKRADCGLRWTTGSGFGAMCKGDSSYQTNFMFNELDATLNWTLLTTRLVRWYWTAPQASLRNGTPTRPTTWR